MLDGQTLLLIFLAIFLMFGANKLPELARSLGKATGEFKKAQLETADEVRNLEKFPEKKFPDDISRQDNISQNIMKLAKDLGIETEGKDENTLLTEIKASVRRQSV